MVHLKGLGPLKIFELLDLLTTGLRLSLWFPHRQAGYSLLFSFGYGNLAPDSMSDILSLSKGDVQRRTKALTGAKYYLVYQSTVRTTYLFLSIPS